MTTQFEIDCALMAGGAYIENRADINQFPTPAGWTEVSDSHFYDSRTGFEAVSFQRGSEIVISYTGTDQAADWYANGGLAFGLNANQLKQAALYYLQVKEANADATITFTGHSLGGGLAALMGVLFNRPAVTFDQAPFANSATVSVRDGVVAYINRLRQSDTPLAEVVPELFSYAGGGDRTGNVSGYYVEGEALQYLKLFSAIGTPTPLTHGSYFAPVDLHSQALLAAFLQSDAFREMTNRLPELLGMVFDTDLFAVSDLKNVTKTNLLELLIRHQAGNVGRTKGVSIN